MNRRHLTGLALLLVGCASSEPPPAPPSPAPPAIVLPREAAPPALPDLYVPVPLPTPSSVPNGPLMKDGAKVKAPDGYVDYCRRHLEDTGCFR